MATNIGEAFIDVNPQTLGFAPKLKAYLKTALTGVKATVPIDADVAKLDAAIAASSKKLAQLQLQASDIQLAAETAKFDAAIAKEQVKLTGLKYTASDIKLIADDKVFSSVIAANRAKVAALRANMSNMKVDLDAKLAIAKLADLEVQAEKLEKRLRINAALEEMTAALPPGMVPEGAKQTLSKTEVDALYARLYAIQAEIKYLNSAPVRIKVESNINAIRAQVAALGAKMFALHQQKAIELAANTRSLNADIAASEARLAALTQKRDVDVGINKAKLDADIAVEEIKLAALTKDREVLVKPEIAPGFGPSLLAALAAIGGGVGKFRDFGNAAGIAGRGLGIFGFFLRGTIGFVRTWHVALSAIIETLVVLAGVIAAATVGAIVMSPAIEDITTNLKAMHTVSEALHQNIGPLTGEIHKLGAAMAPQVVELYGAALGVIGGKMGLLNTYGPRVVTLFDTLAAKFTIWVQAQNSGGKIIQSGIGYIGQLAHIFGQLGNALVHIIQADPGIARTLLTLIGGFASVINAMSGLPLQLLTVALALHGAWVWGNVLARVLLAVGTSAVGAAKGLAGLATNPLFWVAAAAAGIAYLAYQSTQADSATKNFINDMNSGLSQLRASDAIPQISRDIGILNQKIAGLSKIAPPGNLDQFGFNRITGSLKGFKQVLYSSDLVGGIKTVYHALTDTPGFVRTANDIQAYKDQIVKLTDEQSKLFAETGRLIGVQTRYQQVNHASEAGTLLGTKYTYSYAQALAIMDLAGVRASDSFEVMNAKVDNLIRGYANLVGNGPVLANSLNAVTFQALQQQSQIDALIGAWDAFFNTVTGGEDAFLSFASALNTFKVKPGVDQLAQARAIAAVAAAQAALGRALRSGSPSASSAAAATDRLRAAQSHLATLQKSGTATALQLDAATSRVRSAQDHLNAIMHAGGPATGSVTAAADRLRAAQLKLAQVNAAGSASMSGLNANSIQLRQNFQSLVKAGQGQLDSLLKLSSAAGLGAEGTAHVTQAGKDLLQILLPLAKNATPAVVSELFALATQAGYKGAAGDMQALAKWVGKVKDPMKDLSKQTDILTKAAADLKNDVKALSVALGTTLNDAMATAIFRATGGQKVFDNFATTLLNTSSTQKQVHDASLKLATSLYALTGSTKSAHDEFITFATQSLHKTRAEAETLWKQTLPGLQAQIDKMHGKDIPVHVVISAKGKVVATVVGAKIANIPGFGQLNFGGMAAGGKVTAGSTTTADDVLVRVSRGETIVSAAHSKKLAPLFSQIGIPGYAMGGVVTVPGKGVARAGSAGMVAADFAGAHGSAFAGAEGVMYAKTVINAYKQALAQAAVLPAGGLPLGPTGPLSHSAAIAQAFAKSILWAYGWQQNQFPYLQALWTQESGWNAYAQNPSSGAAGIPQNINGWAAYKPGDYQAQIRWGLAYISGRYGSPAAAEAHERAFNWYSQGGKIFDKGGILKPGPNLMWNGTGKTEHLVPRESTGNITVNMHFHGPVGSRAQLEEWLVQSINSAARKGRLIYAFRNSPSGVVR